MAEIGRVRAAWTQELERDCTSLVEAIVSSGTAERNRAWRQLMTHIGPHLEHWAEQSFVLRRYGLASPDDARTVLVNALERLQANDFANLRRFRERQDPGDASDRAETATLNCIIKLASSEEPDGESSEARDDNTQTPFRAWLLTLLGYTVKNHVRDRLGCANRAADSSGPADQPMVSKRDLHTNATRLADSDERGARPPITDFLSMQRFLGEVLEFVETFPHDMQLAIRLWLQETSFEDISTQLGGVPVTQATALVRAGKARLRERFRGDWDQLGGFVR